MYIFCIFVVNVNSLPSVSNVRLLYSRMMKGKKSDNFVVQCLVIFNGMFIYFFKMFGIMKKEGGPKELLECLTERGCFV